MSRREELGPNRTGQPQDNHNQIRPNQTGRGHTRRLVTDSFLTAILFVLQIALAYLPNVELVSLFVMLYTLILGKRAIPILTAFTILEGLVYGFGVWWVAYLYVWPILAGLTWILKRCHSPEWGYAILSCFFGLGFGFLCSLPYLAGGIGAAFAWWISGIPFDLIHGISNLVMTRILLKPFKRLLLFCIAEHIPDNQ